jgi:hypothetical protein
MGGVGVASGLGRTGVGVARGDGSIVPEGRADGFAVGVAACVPAPATTGLDSVAGFVVAWGRATGLRAGEGLGTTVGSEADGPATAAPVDG